MLYFNQNRMRPRDIGLATLAPTLWTVTYIVAKPATAHFPPMFLMSMIYALTGVILAISWRPW